MKARILVVEDDVAVREAVLRYLKRHDYEVVGAGTCDEAERAALDTRPDLAVVDYALPDGTALDLLPRVKAADSSLPFVILTGHGSVELAVRAIKEGADQFLTKPVELAALLLILERLIDGRRRQRMERARQVVQERDDADPFLGASQAIQRLAERARRVLGSDSPILIRGETGTGKGVLARWLHDNGPRAKEAFVDVNCAGLSREFLETELFGHEKGAFTGAAGVKTGLLEVADRGTVFLDEIGDVDQQVQPKLLKALEERRFRRMGGIRDIQIDVRLIAATHQDLESLVERGSFRSDLFYRINTLPLDIPPLRERGEDILPLAHHLLNAFAAHLGRKDLTLSGAADAALLEYRWPGNIRELRNLLERAALLGAHNRIEPSDLGLPGTAPRSDTTLNTRLTLREMERRMIEAVLREEGGRVETTAKRLGLHRSSLYDKIRRHGISIS
ncbi:MAG: sigma-54-dependent Fis family transcriptional regulator [Vicinamibacteria bacterium]|nr:sigma-54-dependent Fis family transcriptional regulator [Vicinamibacteria bacterium]